VVTTGPAIRPDDLKVLVNAEVHSYLPHADVLPTVSLVIGHGGHGTTMAALSRDLPIIVLPMAKFMDQYKIGQVLEQAGAGRLLPKRHHQHESDSLKLTEVVDSLGLPNRGDHL
jgi:UDP:flavonoid glycosyltransferase YjiC (YdhE family)